MMTSICGLNGGLMLVEFTHILLNLVIFLIYTFSHEPSSLVRHIVKLEFDISLLKPLCESNSILFFYSVKHLNPG